MESLLVILNLPKNKRIAVKILAVPVQTVVFDKGTDERDHIVGCFVIGKIPKAGISCSGTFKNVFTVLPIKLGVFTDALRFEPKKQAFVILMKQLAYFGESVWIEFFIVIPISDLL